MTRNWGFEYRSKVLGRGYRAYCVTSVCNACRDLVHLFKDLGIAGLERGILESDDIVARAARPIERACEGRRNRLVKGHGVSDRRAEEADRIKCRRKRRDAVSAG